MKKLKLLFLLYLITTSGCANYTTIRQHKNFSQTFPKYNSVAVVTTEIFITRVTKDGKEYTMPDPSRLANITKMATNALITKNYNVTGVINTNSESVSNDEFNNQYRKAISDMYGNKERSKKENAFSLNNTIGKVAAEIAGKSQADLLLLLGYSGTELSQERVTKSLARDVTMASMGMESQTHVKEGAAFISLINRHNGDILWSNMGNDFETYGKSFVRIITKKNVMETAFENAFKNIPEKGANKQYQ